jgi:hypothetical protein
MPMDKHSKSIEDQKAMKFAADFFTPMKTLVGRNFPLLALAATCLVGCGTATTSKDNWAYTGSDAALRLPPPMRIGDSSDPAWRLEAQEKMAAWQQKRQAAAEAEKSTCARETGQSEASSLWTGYTETFMACMKARGWTKASDPL